MHTQAGGERTKRTEIELHLQDIEVQHKKQIAANQQLLERKDTVIEQKDEVIEQKDNVIEQKDNVIERKDEEIALLKEQLKKLLPSEGLPPE